MKDKEARKDIARLIETIEKLENNISYLRNELAATTYPITFRHGEDTKDTWVSGGYLTYSMTFPEFVKLILDYLALDIRKEKNISLIKKVGKNEK